MVICRKVSPQTTTTEAALPQNGNARQDHAGQGGPVFLPRPKLSARAKALLVGLTAADPLATSDERILARPVV